MLSTILYFLISVIIAFVLVFIFIIRRREITKLFEKITLDERHEGLISLLTYNVAGLPERLSNAKTARKESIKLIGERISGFDIVNVQEDFNYNTSLYANNKHPFRTLHKGKIPFGDGLNTLSKYPILEYRRIPWRNCTGSDCFTPKGFSYVQIKIAKDTLVDVYNVHANAHNSINTSRARRENLNQLARYIKLHSTGMPLLVFGDFNAHYGFKLDNMHEFLEETGLKDGWVELMKDGKYPEIGQDFVIYPILELTDKVESIDKILYRSTERLNFVPITYHIEDKLFEDGYGNPLSDHLAVSMLIKWQIEP